MLDPYLLIVFLRDQKKKPKTNIITPRCLSRRKTASTASTRRQRLPVRAYLSTPTERLSRSPRQHPFVSSARRSWFVELNSRKAKELRHANKAPGQLKLEAAGGPRWNTLGGLDKGEVLAQRLSISVDVLHNDDWAWELTLRDLSGVSCDIFFPQNIH